MSQGNVEILSAAIRRLNETGAGAKASDSCLSSRQKAWVKSPLACRSAGGSNRLTKPWARLVSNQRPLACEATAPDLSPR
jgi:hypothetical protein